MERYLVIDIWNGEGYADSSCDVKLLNNYDEAKVLSGKMLSDLVFNNSDSKVVINSYNIYSSAITISYTIGDNSGLISIEQFADHVGVSLNPNVCSYKVYRDKESWIEFIDQIVESSEEYKESRNSGNSHSTALYGMCHTDPLGDGYDQILVPVYF